MKFIHAADIHLDSPLRGLERYDGAPAEEIREATRRALENLVELAIEEDVDFVLIAGDIYDGDWKDHNTGLFFVLQMSRLRDAGIPVVMISGNHDAANKMTRSLRLPDNVELLPHKRAATAKNEKLKELGVAVHGRSFGKAAEFDNFAVDYPAKLPGLYNIGLLHTSLNEPQGHEPYAPCSIDDLKQKGYDYWALGHVHHRQVQQTEPLIVYPGNIQGRHIRESGPKGCYLATVDGRGETTIKFHSLDVFRWERCDLDIGSLNRDDEILDLFSTELSKLLDRNEGMPIGVRLVLKGKTEKHASLIADSLHWTNQFRAEAVTCSSGKIWLEKVEYETSPLQAVKELPQQDGPVGVLIDYINEVREDESRLLELAEELNDLRRKLPEEIVHGEEAILLNSPEYLQKLLDEVQPLLITRLGKGDSA